MLGRAVRGRPWLFAECEALWKGFEPKAVTARTVFETASLHARLLEAEKGPKAVHPLKSVLSWYIREVRNAASYRQRICTAPDIEYQRLTLREALLGEGAEEGTGAFAGSLTQNPLEGIDEGPSEASPEELSGPSPDA
jgi:tRNA-dihydrouridine synthase